MTEIYQIVKRVTVRKTAGITAINYAGMLFPGEKEITIYKTFVDYKQRKWGAISESDDANGMSRWICLSIPGGSTFAKLIKPSSDNAGVNDYEREELRELLSRALKLLA